MAMIDFPLGHALAVQRWSESLDVEAEVLQYFRKFMGKGPNNMIRIKEDLQKKAGEKITIGLVMKLSGDGAEGDNVIEGTSLEEAPAFYDDAIFISQRRKSTKSKGRMSEQRVPYSMRKIAHDSLVVWNAEDLDQLLMMYAAGKRGIDTSFHFDLDWTTRASNALVDPASTDTDHMYYAGAATSQADLTDADVMKPAEPEKLIARAKTVDPMLQPILLDGAQKFILLMHVFSAYDLRTGYSTGDWGDIRKNTDGKESLIYKDALGEIGGVILHEHRNVIRYDGDNVTVGRNLFFGTQALMIAWGADGGPGRYSWNEEKDDRGNALVVTSGTIHGEKATIYNSKRFGMFAFDSSCENPVS